MNSIQNLKFAFIGGGNMASALINGLRQAGVPLASIMVIERNSQARASLMQNFSLAAQPSINHQLSEYDVLILAVKPQQFHAMTTELRPYIKQQLLFSVAAGLRLDDIQRWFDGHTRLVRAMPNTPALIGAGMTGLTALPNLSIDDRVIAEQIADALGQSLWVENDEQIDALTAVSGSGPAYVFYLIEALQDAATTLGLSAEQGKILATSTFIGAAKLAQMSKETPAELRQRVTSPAGTTFAALSVLETHQIKKIFQDAVYAANKRSAEMAIEFGQQ